jgi:hypothetical protein
LLRWLIAFAFTQLVEVPVYTRALRRDGVTRSLPLALWVSFGASLVTHPVVWFVIPSWWTTLYLAVIDRAPQATLASPLARYVAMALVAETFAVLVEALYFYAWGLRRALVWAFAANALSLSLGLASRALFGLP